MARQFAWLKPYIGKLLRAPRPASGPDVAFPAVSFDSWATFQDGRKTLAADIGARRKRELAIAEYDKKISYQGYCAVCRSDTTFSCEWDIYRTLPDGLREPVWRERLICNRCRLSNRLRASFHFMNSRGSLSAGRKIYLTEQTTPFFDLLQQRFSSVVGSEFLRDGTERGATNAMGLRHEDITALSFDSNQFDCVGSFEVMEHVPDYKAGFRELCRVLKPGGSLVASFPFRSDLFETLVRARVAPSGDIEHLLEPEYHGDPLSAQGVLCFYHFGWDVLDALREAGFSEARCYFYWSWELGYLGGAMPLFEAVK